MTLDSWLQAALKDAEQRGLPDLKPLLEMLARATAALRQADWNGDAAGRSEDRPLQPRNTTVGTGLQAGPPSHG
jgi:hypothetical protein